MNDGEGAAADVAAPEATGTTTVTSGDAPGAARRWLLRGVGLLVLGGLLAVLLRGGGVAETFRGFISALRHANPWLAALAMAINLGPNSLARARRFQLLLGPLPCQRPATLLEVFFVQLGGHVASHLLPARAGEALRVVHLHRRCGYPALALIAAQAVEKVFDVLSMATLALAAIVLLPPGLPATLRASLYGVAGLGALSLLLPVVAGRLRVPIARSAAERHSLMGEGWRGRVVAGLGSLLGALGSLRSPRLWAAAYGWALVADAMDVLMVGVCLRALGIEGQGPAEWLVILVALGVLTAVPLTPGQVGVVEAGAALVLAALGIPRDAGLAFGLLYHATHSLSVVIPGALWLLPLRRAARAAPGGDEGG